MAEAIVDDTPISRFFCHQCSVEIENLLPGYICPRCSSGFIEELERTANTGSSLDIRNEDGTSDDVPIREIFGPFGASAVFRHWTIPIGTNATSRSSRSTEQTSAGTTNRGHNRRNNQDGSLRDLATQVADNTPRNISNRRHFDLLIQEFLRSLSSVGLDFPPGQGGQGALPPDIRLLFGNPGDYVWGREGLDSIVTQLLNQMDTSGPPPLPKKLIDEIPTMNVSQIQVDSKLQCSVCWEHFILSEPVRELACRHYYHAPCIVPWLELHGTCPICRQSLGETDTAEANQDQVGPSLAALFRAAANESAIRNSSASSTSPDSRSRNDSPSEI